MAMPGHIEDHEGLVHMIAKRYHSVDYEDLCQEGRMGLLRAAKDYDPARGAFSTHACHWIRARMRRYVTDHRCVVRLPAYRYNRKEYASQCSLDVPMRAGRDAPSRTWLDTLPANDVAPDDVLAASQDASLVREALATLSEREAYVLRERFWGERTLKEVGEQMGGLSRERVRQIQNEALGKLRKALGAAC